MSYDQGWDRVFSGSKNLQVFAILEQIWQYFDSFFAYKEKYFCQANFQYLQSSSFYAQRIERAKIAFLGILETRYMQPVSASASAGWLAGEFQCVGEVAIDFLPNDRIEPLDVINFYEPRAFFNGSNVYQPCTLYKIVRFPPGVHGWVREPICTNQSLALRAPLWVLRLSPSRESLTKNIYIYIQGIHSIRAVKYAVLLRIRVCCLRRNQRKMLGECKHTR
jgi:hypothetical protein